MKEYISGVESVYTAFHAVSLPSLTLGESQPPINFLLLPADLNFLWFLGFSLDHESIPSNLFRCKDNHWMRIYQPTSMALQTSHAFSA